MLRWIAETTAVTAVLALALSAMGRAGSRWAPASRHALWLIVLLRFVLPSVGHWPLPLTVRIESAGSRATVEPPEPHQSARVATQIAELDEPPRDAAEVLIEDEIDEAETEGPAVGVVQAHHVDEAAAPVASASWWPSPWKLAAVVWAGGAVVLAAVTLVRLARVRSLVRDAGEAPDWLWLEAERLAETFGLARAPRLCVAAAASSPFLWCLGRPRLVVPEMLVKKLSFEQWSGILAHELAHLRRRDHWVSWLALAASLAWWWNPVFWLVRRRLEADAELACDAWAVGTVPESRRPFALALVEVACGSRPAPGAPVLGMSGAGRFLERRLIMIMRERVPYRSTRSAALAAAVLGLLALPAWTRAQEEPRRETPREGERPRAEGRTEERRTEERREVEVRREADERRQPGERREASADDRTRREQIEKARAEVRQIEEQFRKGREQFEQEVQRKQEELRREVDAATKVLRERAEQLTRAQRQLAELEGRPRPPATRLDQEFRLQFRTGGGPGPFGAARSRPAPERRENRTVEVRERAVRDREGEARDRPREGGDIERRMDQLERRFEEILGELRAQRRTPESSRDAQRR